MMTSLFKLGVKVEYKEQTDEVLSKKSRNKCNNNLILQT